MPDMLCRKHSSLIAPPALLFESLPMNSAQRLWIVGPSGSGKTTLAQQVAQATGLAHLELDELFWSENWTYRDLEEAHSALKAFQAEHPEGWVMDGNWNTRLKGLLLPDSPGGATQVVWLDPPRWLILSRILRRTIQRGLLRQTLWHGNREHPRNWLSLDPEKNIILFAWGQVPRLRARYAEFAAQDPRWLRLSGKREVKRWLKSKQTQH